MADPQATPAETSRGTSRETSRNNGPRAGEGAPPSSQQAKPASQTLGTEASALPGSAAPTAEPTAAAKSSAPTAEPRSFEETGSGQGLSAEALARATQPLAEGARQLAEQSRQASRQVADSWRQAVDPLLAMQFEVSQWFDEMFRHAFGFRHGASANPLRPVGLSPASFFGLPPADMREAAQAYTLAVELPGLALADIELRLDGDVLVVSGHKSEEVDDASAAYRVSERRYGRFERSFPLPPDVERERIAAQFKDGVLKVTLPKSASATPRGARIEVKG